MTGHMAEVFGLVLAALVGLQEEAAEGWLLPEHVGVSHRGNNNGWFLVTCVACVVPLKQPSQKGGSTI